MAEPLGQIRHRQGRLLGRMESLGFRLRSEATLETLAEDVLKSSEIEGEFLDREQVRSSLARRLGLDIGALTPAERNVEGVVEMMLDATQHYDRPLSAERLFGWHAALFPIGYSGLRRIRVGTWRDDRSGLRYSEASPGGRRLKRLCTHRYCAGASRTICSMCRLTSAVSAAASSVGKGCSGAPIRSR